MSLYSDLPTITAAEVHGILTESEKGVREICRKKIAMFLVYLIVIKTLLHVYSLGLRDFVARLRLLSFLQYQRQRGKGNGAMQGMQKNRESLSDGEEDDFLVIPPIFWSLLTAI